MILIGARGSGEDGAIADPVNLGLGPEVKALLDGLASGLSATPMTVGYDYVNYAAAPVSTLYPSAGEWARIQSASPARLGSVITDILSSYKSNHLDAFVSSINEGTTIAGQILAKDAADCPNALFVLAGYSQGAMAMHQLTLKLADQGDPLLGRIRSVGLIADGDQKKRTATVSLGTAGPAAEGVRSFFTTGERDIPRPLRSATYSLCDANDIVCDFTLKSIPNYQSDGAIHGTHYRGASSTNLGKLIAGHIADSAWVVTRQLPNARVGVDYSTTLLGTGTGNLTWRATTALPRGLSLSASGVLAGQPTSSGSSIIGVRLTDSARKSATATLSMTVDPAVTPPPPPPADCTAHCNVWLLGNVGVLINGETVDFGDAVSIAAGNWATYALRRDGTVWAVGDNHSGQLGDGTRTASAIPVQVHGLSGVVKIGAAGDGGYALMADGTVWAWGDNTSQQLVAGGPQVVDTPTQILGLANVQDVAGGNSATVALKNDGTVWMQGWDGVNGPILTTPTQVSGLTNVTSISVRAWQAYAVRSDGTVWHWMSGIYDQVGTGTVAAQLGTISNAKSVAANGWGGGYALTTDGKVWAWGFNDYGQLGDGTTIGTATPVQVVGLTGVTAIAGGGYTGYALTQDGTAWGWGMNDSELADPSTTPYVTTPVVLPAVPAAKAIAALWYGVAILAPA